MKKYELLKNDIETLNGRTFYRVRYLRNFATIKKGDLGGYIESENNLSHNGDARVLNNARVCGNARVYENACVYCDALAYGDARIFGNARVGSDARVFENARVFGNAQVYNNACVYGDAFVYDDAFVYGNTQIYDNAWICGDASVYGDAFVCGKARVYGNAQVYGRARVYGDARIFDDVRVYGNTRIFDDSVCATVSPINIIGLRWNITLTDNNIHIGCKTFTFEKALAIASRWKTATLRYVEARTIEDEKKFLVEAIKLRLKQLEMARRANCKEGGKTND